MSAPEYVVGIDVAKAQLDIALRPSGERWTVTNDDAGIAALVARLQAVVVYVGHGRFLLYQVEDSEENNPHEVHKVPVQPGDLDRRELPSAYPFGATALFSSRAGVVIVAYESGSTA